MLWYANRQSGEFQTFVFEGSTPSRSTSIQSAKWWNLRDTQAPDCRALRSRNGAACEFNSRLGYFNDAGEPGSSGPHKPGPSGATPEPATSMRQQRGWASAQPGFICQARRVRPPDPLLPMVEYANRQSGKHERLVILQVRLLSRLL